MYHSDSASGLNCNWSVHSVVNCDRADDDAGPHREGPSVSIAWKPCILADAQLGVPAMLVVGQLSGDDSAPSFMPDRSRQKLIVSAFMARPIAFTATLQI